MIRTQLLLWLVALGWASEAEADIKLTLKHEYSRGDTVFVREDAGETEIEVTATKVKTIEKDTYVTLGIKSPDGCDSGLNSRYRITLPTLIIPADKSEATGTIIFIPIDDKDEEDCDDSFSKSQAMPALPQSPPSRVSACSTTTKQARKSSSGFLSPRSARRRVRPISSSQQN